MNRLSALHGVVLLTVSLLWPVIGWSQPASQILHEMEKLRFNGSVLYIAAHPDDENTRLIAWLTHARHADVSYLSLTRGDGGQNLIGKEIGQGLGLLRTCELMAARKIDGGRQYFTRAIDFGYSKTPAETYRFWNKEAVLSDMVLVIRQLQPDIIITRFSEIEDPEHPTHGHHTASAQLAFEAMDAAADPKHFPEQLKLHGVWQVKKLYWNSSWWFYGSQELMEKQVAEAPEKYLKMDVNTWLPLLGSYCSDIAAKSRSQHKSQGFGSTGVVGEQMEYLELKRSVVGKGDLFEGIPVGWNEISGGKPIQARIDQIIARFDPRSPSASLPALFELRKLLELLPDSQKWKSVALDRTDRLIVACAGIKAQAYSAVQHIAAGEELNVDFELSAAPGIEVNLSSAQFAGLQVSDSFKPVFAQGRWQQKCKLQVLRDVEKSQPFWLVGEAEAGTYTFPDSLAGVAQNTYPYRLSLELLIQGHLHRHTLPVLYHVTDPVKGSIEQPMMLRPDIMLNVSTAVLIFPDSGPRTLKVDVIAGKAGMEGYVELNLPQGWRAEPAFFPCKLIRKDEQMSFTFRVWPPESAQVGRIRAIFKNDRVYSNSLERLKYDHIPELEWYPTAELSGIRIDLKRKGHRIAYVNGAGDQVAEYLGAIGYEVSLFEPAQVTPELLAPFDAVVVGVRAFNTYEQSDVLNAALNTYCKGGGTVVVQYHTSRGLKTGQLGPLKLVLGRDRVTQEDAEVRFLAPDHPVVNWPNKLTQSDFEGWVQERGLYFASSWDEAYQPLFAMHDEGEEDGKGSLLVAQYGSGHYIFTGLSFFRQLPAGVAGAYRLFANLIALGQK